MRYMLVLAALAALMGANVADAQSSAVMPVPPPPGPAASNAQPAPGPSPNQDTQGGDDKLPVSLEHIREALAKPQPTFTFDFNVPSTFRTEVHEQNRFEDLIKPLNPSTPQGGPVPAGGAYNYEMQRVMHNPVNEPLFQPYAAFNGGELLTLSLEALAERYLGGRALSSVSNAERARAEAAARHEVLHAIADWCAANPDRAPDEPTCRNPSVP